VPARTVPRAGRVAEQPEGFGRDRSGSRTGTSVAAPASTSDIAGASVEITGVPQAIASRGGSPKPSNSREDERRRAEAAPPADSSGM
jgi:hypothetical protein